MIDGSEKHICQLSLEFQSLLVIERCSNSTNLKYQLKNLQPVAATCFVKSLCVSHVAQY